MMIELNTEKWHFDDFREAFRILNDEGLELYKIKKEYIRKSLIMIIFMIWIWRRN